MIYLRYFRNKFLLNFLIEVLFGFKTGETRCLSTQVQLHSWTL